ncbi:MAG: Ig-like domain-containing protein [Oscillospiraceae bacterium]|nr:Ig-like domain-containing protein [Oscillospiraceae bacterium]
MKKLLKKITAVIMTATIAISSMIVTTTASAAGVFDGAKKMEPLEYYSKTFVANNGIETLTYKITLSSESRIELRYTECTQGLEGMLYNTNGELIMKYNFNGFLKLNSDDVALPKGTYYLRITESDYYDHHTLSFKDLYYIVKPTNKPTISLKLTMKKGTSIQLGSIVENYDGKVTWTSTKKSVATVSSTGKVTAKKKGTTTIRAQLDDGTYVQIKIVVKK